MQNIKPLQTNKKIISNKEAMEELERYKPPKENALNLIKIAEEYVFKYGQKKRKEPYNFDSNMSGSDAVRVSSDSLEYILEQDNFKIIIEDIHRSQSDGTYSVNWEERNDRIIKITLGQETLIRAEKTLGGEKGFSGFLSSSKEKINPTEWNIRIEKNLDKVIEYLEKIKNK